MSIAEKNRLRMVVLLKELTTGEGMRPTLLDGVKLARADSSLPRTPVLYEPSIVIVASGRKRGFVGDRVFTYDPNNYLVLSVPLPFECETEVGDGEPMLGVSIRVELSVLSELTTKMNMRRRTTPGDTQRSVYATPLNHQLSEGTIRLLECLRSPMDAELLGSGIVREIMYRVLGGEQGGALWDLLGMHGQVAEVHALLQRMHARYAESWDVTQMAEDTGMSISAFHSSFKAVTGTSPLQYLKTTRLHKARIMMVHDAVGTAVAADRVGYQSASQFSREFKRFFGRPPLEEMKRVKTMLGLGTSGNASIA